MKRRFLSILAAVAFVAAAVPAYAQDVDPTGTWDLTFSTDQGPIGAQMVITKQGERYVGSIVSDLGEAQLEAQVKGKDVSVGFSMAMNGGGALDVALNATITGDEIKGTYDAGASGGGTFSGARQAKAAAGGTGDQKPDATVDVTGNYDVSVVTPSISASPGLSLKQEGEKLTGEYESAQYGKFPLSGTVKGTAVEFSVEMTIEGNSIVASFSGTVENGVIKGSVAYADFAEGTFTATKKK